MNTRERNTIIAALRLLQQHKVSGFVNPDIEALEIDGGTTAMSPFEVERLVHEVNHRTLASDYEIEHKAYRREVRVVPEAVGLGIHIEGCVSADSEDGPVIFIELDREGTPVVQVFHNANDSDPKTISLAKAMA